MKKPMSTRVFKIPHTNIQLLTNTSKMPSWSWGLPAHRSCPRANGTICANCYAEKGRYIMPNVRDAMEARFAWTRESLKTAEGQAEWVRVMIEAIRDAAKFEPVFRVHDSGDLFSAAYVRMWIEVCKTLADVRFWFPTRAWQQPRPNGAFVVMGQGDATMDAIRVLAALPNVTVRPSALNFGEEAPRVAGLAAGSTAVDGESVNAYHCPAPTQNGECGACRHCWLSPSEPVAYHRH